MKFGTGEPPEALLDIDGLKHKDQRVLSLINIPLWNKGGWRAILYLLLPHTLPIMGLGFADSTAARNIFLGLKKRLGDIDKDEQLRISVITGIDKAHPAYYRVVISTDLESRGLDTHNYYVLVSRVQTMQPPNSTNLDNFLDRYKLAGQYVVLPACFVSEGSLPEPLGISELSKPNS